MPERRRRNEFMRISLGKRAVPLFNCLPSYYDNNVYRGWHVPRKRGLRERILGFLRRIIKKVRSCGGTRKGR